jgi:hypothetical protein
MKKLLQRNLFERLLFFGAWFVIIVGCAGKSSSADANVLPSHPSLDVLGSPGSYYLGIDWGMGVLWRHSNVGPGDIDIYDAAGASFTNIVYDGYSLNGNTTIFAAKTLDPGLTLATKMEDEGAGVYKITHSLTSTTDRWLRLDRSLRDGAGGSSVAATSDVLSYHNRISASSDTAPFHAAAAHHSSGFAVGLIAGNGFDNDYCVFDWGYAGHTDWYNKDIVSRTANSVKVTYGLLKSGSTTDYTVRLQAGVTRSVSYVINIFTPSSQPSLNAALYSAYYTAYSPSPLTDNAIEQMLWATAHQLQQIKRHIRVEGAKRLVIAPCNRGYSGMISAGDMINAAIGINSAFTMNEALETLHHLGPPTGEALISSVMGGPDNNMDGSYGLYIPFIELYAHKFLGYAPDAFAKSIYLATADSYADAINNVKMLPDASTRLAHLYANIFGSAEVVGYGDFENDFSFPMSSDTIYRWSEEVSDGLTARVGTDNGHSPHSGKFQCKLVSTGGFARRRLMPMAVPPSRKLTAVAYVNIPVHFASGGFRFNIIEKNNSGATVATSTSVDVSAATNWKRQPYTWTLNPGTCYVLIGIEAHGSGTVYVDDVQCTMLDPEYPGLLWSPCSMPPQIKGTELSTGSFSMTWAQLNLKCLKVLLGRNWTRAHQRALDAVDKTYPAAYWTDSSQIKLREDTYHPVRKNWLTSYALFGHCMWYSLSGEKIFSDNQIASVYANYPKTSANGPYGDVAFKGWLCNMDGSPLGKEANWLSNWPSTAGWYVNGGCWLWASDVFFYKSAIAAGVPGAETALQARLKLEVYRVYASHESFDTSGNATPVEGYAGNALMLIK